MYIYVYMGASIASRRAALGVSPSQRLSACKGMYIHTGKCLYMSIYYRYIYIHIGKCICMYIYIRVCIYMGATLERLRGGEGNIMHVYVNMYTYIYICIHIYI